MGLVLVAAVVVASFAVIFFAVAGDRDLRSPTPNASVSQSSGGLVARRRARPELTLGPSAAAGRTVPRASRARARDL